MKKQVFLALILGVCILPLSSFKLINKQETPKMLKCQYPGELGDF